jgi:hypothetical protein
MAEPRPLGNRAGKRRSPGKGSRAWGPKAPAPLLRPITLCRFRRGARSKGEPEFTNSMSKVFKNNIFNKKSNKNDKERSAKLER